MESTSSGGGVSSVKNIVGLVGSALGPVRASYARVNVTGSQSASFVNAGGLLRSMDYTTIVASYATGAVSGGGSDASNVASLVSYVSGGTNSTVTASYATGAITRHANANKNGLLTPPQFSPGPTINNSYWDVTSSGIADGNPSASPGTGKTTGELQTPTAYGTSTSTNIYVNWNVNVDDDTGTGAMTTGTDDP